MMNVLIVEDDSMAKSLLEMYITKSENYRLVDAIASASMAELYCTRNNVDLILMDVLTEFEASGLDYAERIKKNHPNIKIIIMTSLPEYDFIERAKAQGADSFWYKSPSQDEIIDIMDRTMQGENIYPNNHAVIKVGEALSSDFTKLEIKILRELTSGDTDEEIANRLNFSPWTVRKYVKTILEKTGFKSRTQLAIAAREKGLVVKGY